MIRDLDGFLNFSPVAVRDRIGLGSEAPGSSPLPCSRPFVSCVSRFPSVPAPSLRLEAPDRPYLCVPACRVGPLLIEPCFDVASTLQVGSPHAP